jgi:AcrR family transcriptional regulator
MTSQPTRMAGGESARGRIHKAALRLFAENGANGLTVSDLADAAGIARGTIYNNIEEPENLFGEVATALSEEMLARTEATMEPLTDPAERIATGLRLFVRRAHEEQDWGRFLVRFALNSAPLVDTMRAPPGRDIARAIETGRFRIGAVKAAALLSLLTGATLAALNAVIIGDETWRDAGTSASELFLRAAGLSAAEARRIARTELPPLSSNQPIQRARKRRAS